MRRVLLFVIACMTMVGIIWLVREHEPAEPTGSSVGSESGPTATAVEPSTERLPHSDSQPLPAVLVDPSVLIEKERRALSVRSGSQTVKTYRIALGREPVGDKRAEGDGKTPEGEFYICTKNPESQYGRSLGLSYPAEDDAERGLAEGLISRREYRQILDALRRYEQPSWSTALGGEIMIHGGGSASDWTAGCIALEAHEIEELFSALPLGTPVTIEP